MSFFFDVWTSEGFVLASDVRMTINGKTYADHKIAISASSSKVKCAIVVCGDYPDACKSFFMESSSRNDTFREIAREFADKWTNKFAGENNYSAVHLVGFEKIPDTELFVPQMWYWTNWMGPEAESFHDSDTLNAQLDSFTQSIPHNNHIPQKIKELIGIFPGSTLDEENTYVRSFIATNEPLFTWNGDNMFWRSALTTVLSALNLLWAGKKRKKLTIDETAGLALECLAFLAKVGSFLPDSTVGLSERQECDVVAVTQDGVNRISWTELD